VLPLWFSGIPKIVLQKFPSWSQNSQATGTAGKTNEK